jgi:predicted ATPase
MGMDSYYSPTGSVDNEITAIWNQLTNSSAASFKNIEVAQGRTIPCYKQAKNVAEFSFAELCDENRGSSDYMAIANNY